MPESGPETIAAEGPARPVRVVCFDWGGVILRICRSWAEACARAGVELVVDDEAFAAKRRSVAEAYQLGRLGDDEFVQRVSEACLGKYTPEQVRRVHEAWLIEEYRGMAEVVGALNARDGVSTGLLSNTNGLHWREQLGVNEGGTGRFRVARSIEIRVGSQQVGLAKPDPAVYGAFEAVSGAHGREVLFFDDLAENVKAARARGWRAERVAPDGEPAELISASLRAHGVL
ncbi:MAG: HAD-IA family hydrolase [Planctomycetota bacterium]